MEHLNVFVLIILKCFLYSLRFQFKFVRHLDYLSKICTHLR